MKDTPLLVPLIPGLRFEPGRLVATPDALEAMKTEACNPFELLVAHVTGDCEWLDDAQEEANRQALEKGGPILSFFPIARCLGIAIITAADRTQTTFELLHGTEE
jgi:hypothetical protein